jgi:hypothetical protein
MVNYELPTDKFKREEYNIHQRLLDMEFEVRMEDNKLEAPNTECIPIYKMNQTTEWNNHPGSLRDIISSIIKPGGLSDSINEGKDYIPPEEFKEIRQRCDALREYLLKSLQQVSK